MLTAEQVEDLQKARACLERIAALGGAAHESLMRARIDGLPKLNLSPLGLLYHKIGDELDADRMEKNRRGRLAGLDRYVA